MRVEEEAQSLHDVACGISISLEKRAISHDRGGRAGILHVSGTPFLKTRKQAGYLGDSIISSLCPFQLCQLGRRLECGWSIVLGQGGYAKVFYGQILPFRTEVSGNMTLVWRVMRPFLSPLAQASTLLTYKPLHDLTTASRGYAALAWQIVVKTAEIWGLASPCAVKVLQDRSPNAGAYGSRSVEHEVLITMHISSACASCPYIGKAYGFDLADKVAPLIHSHSPSCPCSSADCPNPACSDADAVLLVLEAYTVDLKSHIELHKQHAPNCKEFPCARCMHRPQQENECRALTIRAASAATAPLQALAVPIHAAKATACMFASAVSSSAQTKDRTQGSQIPAQGGQLDSPQGQVVSLWEYATRLRESGLVMSVPELMRIALELAEAVHALHTVAHVMHLDIKPQNVLLDSQFQVKLLDFGLSAAFKPERPFIILQSKGRGTRPYTAPELLAGSSGTVSPAADIYSLGCCVAAVSAQSRGIGACAAEPPDVFGLLKKGVKRHTDLSPFAPKELHSLLKACLSEHAFERPCASQVLDELRAASAQTPSTQSQEQLQPCASTPTVASTPPQQPAQRPPPHPLQSFPVLPDVTGAASCSAVQLIHNPLLGEDASQPTRPVSPVLPVSQDVCEPMRRIHGSRSFSLAGSDATRGGACVSGVGRSRGNTQILTSPRLCSNVTDGSSASRGGVSGVWSSVCASDVQRGGRAMHTSDVVCNGGMVGEGCRPMPHTTSVRYGLASVMRPLSAQSSSVSGWLSEGSTSMSFASHGTAY